MLFDYLLEAVKPAGSNNNATTNTTTATGTSDTTTAGGNDTSTAVTRLLHTITPVQQMTLTRQPVH